ncbi:glycerate kinase [Nephila pilipes]|uniref:Glycerate kinase n=1 Tax=Nephila pilipes TaxID=299642 RepID=A0A8X6T9N4_NEPPI|nr:glycerate kinase [Nephila pilipes]
MSTDTMCKDARMIFEAAYKSVQPFNLINKEIKVNLDELQIQGKRYTISKNVYVVGFGKAVLGMSAVLEAKLKEHLVSGIISVPEGIQSALKTKLQNYPETKSRIQIYEGASKNIPDDNSLLAATKITELVSNLIESDFLIVLISGGGSALLPAPKPPLTLKDKQNVIQLLASRGAQIEELNAVRKQLSMLKGGKLALLAKPAKVVSLILSDIIDDPLGMIASGPTVQNTDNPSLAMSIIEKYELLNLLPESAIQILTNTSAENEKNGDFSHVTNFIIGNNVTALDAAARVAENLDYDPIILTNELKGIASSTGKNLILLIIAALQSKYELFSNIYEKLQLQSHLKGILYYNLINFLDENKKLSILLGGETTVEVHGSGIGGRNQELALAAALELHDKFNRRITLLSAGTDGIDGPTCAAGAIATFYVIEEAKTKGLNPSSFLSNNDSHTFFSELNDGQWLVKTGHTGTNVMDVIIILMS